MRTRQHGQQDSLPRRDLPGTLLLGTTFVSYTFRIPTIGVEEEYQLVDGETGVLKPTGNAVLKQAIGIEHSTIQNELHLEQIEMASEVLNSTQAVRNCLIESRTALMHAARQNESVLVAAGTNPMTLPEHGQITPKPRYLEVAQQYQLLARDLLIFGCHVHVHMPDKEVGVQVMNFTRGWLPLLQAMSANSPFWQGEDTGYASYRREMWVQWPMSGIPGWFDDLTDYQQCIQGLVQAEAIDDETKIYWDLRLPARVPTIEFRVFDVQTEIEDCVALVAITRALVMRCEAGLRAGERPPRIRRELLRSAIWRAARYGLSERLIDPQASSLIDAFEHLQQLLQFIKEPLAELGDTELVAAYVQRLREQGTPADRQRRAYLSSESRLRSVIDYMVARTLPR
ncbi:carboxylate-amine ligase [Pirellulaceae bacterium SH449]